MLAAMYDLCCCKIYHCFSCPDIPAKVWQHKLFCSGKWRSPMVAMLCRPNWNGWAGTPVNLHICSSRCRARRGCWARRMMPSNRLRCALLCCLMFAGAMHHARALAFPVRSMSCTVILMKKLPRTSPACVLTTLIIDNAEMSCSSYHTPCTMRHAF